MKPFAERKQAFADQWRRAGYQRLSLNKKMNSKLLIVAFAINLQQMPVHLRAQTSQIRSVESHLKPHIQIEDSPYTRFSIDDRLKFYNIPSVSITVIDDGKIAWAKAYGFADLEAGIRATKTTIYQAASMSKTANAALVIRLTQRHVLSLDTDIREYLKTWELPENSFSTGHTITIRDLLSHRAGIGVHGFEGYKPGTALPSLDDILNGRSPANNELVKPDTFPNTITSYSGGGIMIVQKVLEDVLQESYSSLINAEVLGPLHMNHSNYQQPLSPALQRTAATGYNTHQNAIVGKYYVYPELAPAGLWSTPTDMAKLIIAVQQSSTTDRPFLDKQFATLMVTPVSDSDNAALGSFVYKIGVDVYFAHDGHNRGFTCVYYGSLHSGQGAVIMLNSDNNGIIPEILNSIAETYHWKDFYQPEVKQAVRLPDSMKDRYTGNYYCVQLKRKIQIRKAGHNLEMRQELEFNKGDGCFEKVYFSNQNTFFTQTSDLIWSFPSNATDILNIKDGNDLYIATKVK
jgi:CubicO group peptidase (beta-lactamase class C family)